MHVTKVAPLVWKVDVGSPHHHYRIRRFGKDFVAFRMDATTCNDIGKGRNLAEAQQVIRRIEAVQA